MEGKIMKHLRCSVMVGVVLLTLVGWAGLSLAAVIDKTIAAAKKEGVLEFYGPSTLTPEGCRKLGEAFNKRYDLNLKVTYNPSGSMTRDVGKVVGMAATGVPPEWDMMAVTDAHHGRLYLRKLHEKFDYQTLGVDTKVIHYDNSTVAFANQFVLPAYNKDILPAGDVPKSWDDVVSPKWKGGKLAVIHSTHHLARLAVGPWGEAKTTAFVEKLAALKPILGRPGEQFNRLITGEVLLCATLQNSFIHRAKRRGAPLVQAEGIEPVISPQYHAGVPKNAPHPNAGHLMVAFLTTPEGQKIWEKYTGHSSAFVPGTTAYRYAQGKQVLFMTQDQAKDVSRLSKEYGSMLGFRTKKKKKK